MKQNVTIEERAEEVRLLVINDVDLDRATLRLLDLSKQFCKSKEHQRESLVLRQEFSSIRSEMRYAVSYDDKRRLQTSLSRKILGLLEDIQREHTETFQNLEVFPNPDDFETDTGILTEQKQISSQKNYLTSFEKAKEEFIQTQQNNRAKLSGITICNAAGLCKRYKQNSTFEFTDISLTLGAGRITGIVGENGSGKTTLLKILAGELAPDQGNIIFPIWESKKQKGDCLMAKHHIAYMPQQLKKWHGVVEDTLSFSASIHGITGKENREEVEFMIYRLGLEQYRHFRWHEISGGYKTRFELAKLMIWKPELLILDEPLAHLDINTQPAFLQDLRDLANSVINPLAVIITSQHLYEIENIVDEIMFIKDGKCKFYGELSQISEQREVNTFEFTCTYLKNRITKDQIYSLLQDIQIKDIEDNNSYFTIHTSRNVSSERLLSCITANRDVEIQYFRNISNSTKALFRGR